MEETGILQLILQAMQKYGPFAATLAVPTWYLYKRVRLCQAELKWWRERAEAYEKERERLIELLGRYGLAPLASIEDVRRLLVGRKLLYEFLRMLDRDGVVSLEDIEKLVYKGLRKTKNIMLLISQAGQEWEQLRKYIASKLGYDEPKSLLLMYVEQVLLKKFSEYIEDVINYNMYVAGVRPTGFRGVSSLVLVLREGVDVYKSIELGYRIVGDFYEFLRESLTACISENICKSDSMERLRPFVNPIFVFTPPLPPHVLLSSLGDEHGFEHLRLVLYALGDERRRIRYLLGGAKVAHMFQVAGYGEEIVSRLKGYEEDIRRMLRVENFMDYFALPDPLGEILAAIHRLDRRLYDVIAADQRRLDTVARLAEELKKLSEAL